MDLSTFTTHGLDRGRPRSVEIAWYLTKLVFFTSGVPWPGRIRTRLLRAFGAQVGERLYIRPRVNIHFPWKLSVGDDCWIGEGCTILNLEPVTIRSGSALAHEVYIAAAGHDVASASMAYANEPVEIESQCWIGTRAFIGPGCVVGEGTVVAAGAVVVGSTDPWTIVAGVPARRIKDRSVTRP